MNSKNNTPLRKAPDPPNNLNSAALTQSTKPAQKSNSKISVNTAATVNTIATAPLPSPNEEEIATQRSEILSLRKKLNEVTEKNIAWQKYNEEREDYVRGLFQKNQALNVENLNCKNEVIKLRSHPEELASEQRKYLDKIIANLQTELHNLSEKHNKITNENTWFKSNYDTSLEEIRILKSKLKNSKTELKHEKDNKLFKDETSKALKQRIELLESNNKLLELQLNKAKRNVLNISKKNSQIEMQLLSKTNRIKELEKLEEKRKSFSDYKSREEKILGEFDELYRSPNPNTCRRDRETVGPPTNTRNSPKSPNWFNSKPQLPLNMKVVTRGREEKEQSSEKEKKIKSARTEKRSKSEENDKERQRHSFDYEDHITTHAGPKKSNMKSPNKTKSKLKTHHTPNFDLNPLILRYSTKDSDSDRSGGNLLSDRSDRSGARRKSHTGSGRNEKREREIEKKESQKYICDFCGASFCDYKRLIRHYDKCDKI